MPLVKRSLIVLLAIFVMSCSRSPEPSHARSNQSKAHDAIVKPLSEDEALTLLVKQLKVHKVADIDCLQFFDENDGPPNTRSQEWQFAAHENHDERCGGDPETSPVRDRYKVKASGAVSVYNVAEDEYRPL